MNKFYIIQSLKPTDPELGQRVYNKIKDISTSEFFKVTNKNELLSTLDYIKLDLTTNPDLKAVIHIHCHGNDQGIGIRDDNDTREFVYWEDLRDKFREIYVSTNKKPLLSMCACKGFNVFQIATEGYKKLEMTPEKIKIRRDSIEKIIIDQFGFINEEQKNYLDYAFSDEGTDEYLEKYRSVFFS